MNLIFFGPSGSGKDTQADLLVEKYGYTSVSSGELLREISTGDREIHGYIREAMNEGFLEDGFVYGLLQIYLKYNFKEKLILSGVVRKESQIDLLDKVLEKINKKLDYAVYFELSDEVAIERMVNRRYCPNCKANYHTVYNPPKVENKCDKCASMLKVRDDDNEESIKRRLDDFHKDNNSILKLYEERRILVKIDASQSIDLIHEQLIKKLNID